MSMAAPEPELEQPLDITPKDKLKGPPGLRCVIVTPESTVLDQSAQFVALPLFDGELGVAKGRAPLIGRLGFGGLRIRDDRGTRHVFIDGGFAQVCDDVVTVLTPRALEPSKVDAAAARAELDAAKSRRATSEVELTEKSRSEARARALIRFAEVRGRSV